MRSTLVFSAPHSPLSVVITMRPTRFTESRSTRKGCRYSGLACEICAATLRIFSAYGRAARMRSCALRIFDAATISIALVILRVFCTLLILVRISFVPAIDPQSGFTGRPDQTVAERSITAALLPVLDRFVQRFFILAGQFLV